MPDIVKICLKARTISCCWASCYILDLDEPPRDRFCGVQSDREVKIVIELRKDEEETEASPQ